MNARAVTLTAALAALAPGSFAHAQAADERCDLLPNPTRQFNIMNSGTPTESWYVTEAEFVCPGGRRLVAQTATYSLGAGQITLNGNVQIDDSESTLRSQFAQYFTETEQLHARTNVVLRETRNGSVIMSELLDVYQETPERASLLIATGGRPRAIIFQQTGAAKASAVQDAASADPLSAAADTAAPEPLSASAQEPLPRGIDVAPPVTRDSTIIDAQEIRITGGDTFRGTGNAVLRRDSLTATGHAIEFSDASRRLDVMGGAVVQLPSQELHGDTITATVDAEDQIEAVLAKHAASLTAEDMNVTAPAIRLLFTNGGIERLVAMNWEAAPGAAPAARPHVESDAFALDADSIDVLAPNQQITEAVAIGDARGERILPDSLQALLPEATPEVLALLSRDWMRGDTVRARFAPNPRAEVDSTADATVMEQLAAHGRQAQSMYSVRDENEPEKKLSFNYLLSSYIEVNFADGEVSTVSAAGDAKGVYLQPAEAVRATGSGTLGAAPPPPGANR
jgi:lipopolysaccharide export system protein LptA